LPSEIEESKCGREGELKIKLEKEKVQGIERETENLKIKKIKKSGEKKKNWRGGGTVRKREKKSESEGDLKKKEMREGEEEWERGRF
jgi:hypothetical protein